MTQKRNPPNRVSPKHSITLPKDMTAWLRRTARLKRITFSAALKLALTPSFEARRKS